MSAKIHLGVQMDVYYNGVPTPVVAMALEEKYKVMGVFVKKNRDFIQDAAVREMTGQMNRLLKGTDVKDLDFTQTCNKIQTLFKKYIKDNEWEQLTGNIIEAAVRGVKTRKNGKRVVTHVPRPAFLDTGLYRKSFRAWT